MSPGAFEAGRTKTNNLKSKKTMRFFRLINKRGETEYAVFGSLEALRATFKGLRSVVELTREEFVRAVY